MMMSHPDDQTSLMRLIALYYYLVWVSRSVVVEAFVVLVGTRQARTKTLAGLPLTPRIRDLMHPCPAMVEETALLNCPGGIKQGKRVCSDPFWTRSYWEVRLCSRSFQYSLGNVDTNLDQGHKKQSPYLLESMKQLQEGSPVRARNRNFVKSAAQKYAS